MNTKNKTTIVNTYARVCDVTQVNPQIRPLLPAHTTLHSYHVPCCAQSHSATLIHCESLGYMTLPDGNDPKGVSCRRYRQSQAPHDTISRFKYSCLECPTVHRVLPAHRLPSYPPPHHRPRRHLHLHLHPSPRLLLSSDALAPPPPRPLSSFSPLQRV